MCRHFLAAVEAVDCRDAKLTNAVWDGSASNPLLYTYRLGLKQQEKWFTFDIDEQCGYEV